MAERFKVSDNITLSAKQHEDLVQYLKDRLDFANRYREAWINKLENIDREWAGYIKLEEDDRKREQENKRGLGPKTTDVNLELVSSQIEDLITYNADVLSADDGLYKAIAPKEKMPFAQGFSKRMNDDAEQYKHYIHLCLGLLDQFRYNFGGWTVKWKAKRGNTMTANQIGDLEYAPGVVYEGNSVERCDPYNTLYDQSVEPWEVFDKGEFFATVAVVTQFRTKKMEAEGDLFNVDRIVDTFQYETKYWREKPDVAFLVEDSVPNWDSTFTGDQGTNSGVGHKVEIVDMYIWIDPSKFGLSRTKQMQIWRFKYVADSYVMYAEFIDNAHGYLPIALGRPKSDGFGHQTKSYAQTLIGPSRFANNELNVHQRAARKALYGVTFYNKNVLPVGDVDEAIMLGGKVPVKATGTDMDINRSIRQMSDVPLTGQTVPANIQMAIDLMQHLIPTNLTQQLVDLDRATMYHAAATVYSGNRKNFKMAKTINDQSWSVVREIQMYNLFQYAGQIEYIDENGKLGEFPAAQLADTGIRFTISFGLKGVDKFLMVNAVEQIIHMTIQNQQAFQRINVVDLIDHMMRMLGDEADYKQFAYDNPFDQLPEDAKLMAFQLLQQAVGQAQAGQQPTGPTAGSAPALNGGGENAATA